MISAKDIEMLKAWAYHRQVETDAFTNDVKLAYAIEGVIKRMEDAEARSVLAPHFRIALEKIAYSDIGSEGKIARDALGFSSHAEFVASTTQHEIKQEK